MWMRTRRAVALQQMSNAQTPFCKKVAEYLQEKANKARFHTVITTGNVRRRWEVTCRTKGGFGSSTGVMTHEVTLGHESDNTCSCSCNKPKLLHKPCSHVLAACAKIKLDSTLYVSTFYLKDRVLNAWSAEILGWRSLQHLVESRGKKRIYVPYLDLLKAGKGRRQTRRLRNDMDASEAEGPVRRCEDCLQYGHRTKDYNNNKEGTSSSLEPRQQHMEEEWPYPLFSKEIDARHRAKKISDGNSCSSLAVLIPPKVGENPGAQCVQYFTESFESLRENEVRWTPYTNEEANLREPNGVSILFYHDEAYWMTRKMLVYDIFVEGYNVQRVMRQMRLYQQVSVPAGLHLPPDMHKQKRQADNRYRRSMHLRMTPWIEAWSQALNDVTNIARELVRDAKTLWEKLRDGIAGTNQEVMAAVDSIRRKEGTRMVCPVPQMPHARPHMIPQMTPDVQISHWQGGFAPFAGILLTIYFLILIGPTQPVPLHAPTDGTNPWQGQSMDYGADDAPQVTQPTQPEDGNLQGNDNDPRRSNRERHEPNRLSLSGPRHAAGGRKKTTKKRADTSRTMTDHDDE
uniref:SWIM-type domain-containing protein n=1 Tax=Oryza punctata TaxID=4537 RepID=A0A0E0LCF2_ORYPU